MRAAGQRVPETPTTELTPEERILRAKLMVEEVLETCNALGVQVHFWGQAINRGHTGTQDWAGPAIQPSDYKIVGDLDLVEAVDGCCDVKVVTTGTLSALGVSDDSVQEEVDKSNLRKFGPGGYKREDGKWIKGPDWRPPRLLEILIEQGWEAEKGSA